MTRSAALKLHLWIFEIRSRATTKRKELYRRKDRAETRLRTARRRSG